MGDPNFKKMYGDMDVDPGQKLSRPPKGYEAENPAIEFLKLKSFTASRKIPDNLLTSDKFIPFVKESLIALKPLISFINRGLMSDEDGGI